MTLVGAGPNSQVIANNTDTQSLAEQARQCVQQGALPQAEQLYRRVLDTSPHNSDALCFFGIQALNTGQLDQSVTYFERALAQNPDDAALHKNLGLAHRARGALHEALSAFDKALFLKPDFPIALLHKGAIHEELGEQQLALSAYLQAFNQAEKARLLLHMTALPAGTRALFKRAAAAVQQGREEWLGNALASLRTREGATALARVDYCLDIYFRRVTAATLHPLQHPTLLTFPDIPTKPWFERHEFPWIKDIEKHTPVIRAELLELLRKNAGFRPFITMPSDRPGTAYWRELNNSSNWNAYFFYRDGKRIEENCRRCPVTATALDSIPLARIAGHSPEVFFSVLASGTHIPVHTGVINCRLVVHLPLCIPPECGITVGGETRGWREGECLIFDDTFEHEAWNHSSDSRVVLIFDIWNPYLTETEREAMKCVVEGLGRFNQTYGLNNQVYESI